MHPKLRGREYLVSRAVSGLLVGAVLGTMVALVLMNRMGALGTGADESPTPSSSEPLQQAIHDHRCSTEGFGSEAIPSSALIRRASGDLALVSFERGWAVHQDPHSAAELVAVCLDEPAPGVAQQEP